MPKFLDVPTWYGSSNTTLLSLWETSGTSGQLLKSNGSSAPTWSSFSKTNTWIDCAVFRASFGTSSTTGTNTAEGFLYVNVPGGGATSASDLWNFLDDNDYTGVFNGSSETTFFPAVGFGFSKYDDNTVNAVMAVGIAKNGTSAGADPTFKVLRKYFHPLKGSGADTTSWGTQIVSLYTFDATDSPLFRTQQVVSNVSVG